MYILSSLACGYVHNSALSKRAMLIARLLDEYIYSVDRTPYIMHFHPCLPVPGHLPLQDRLLHVWQFVQSMYFVLKVPQPLPQAVVETRPTAVVLTEEILESGQ